MQEVLFVSYFMVMQSAAGYYIGQYCYEDMGDGEWLLQPYDRDTGYYKTREQAELMLKGYKGEARTETEEEYEARFILYKKRLKK